MKKQTRKNLKSNSGFFNKVKKSLTSLTMQKTVLAVAIIFALTFIVTAGNVIIKNGQITSADNLTVDTNTLVVDATNDKVAIGTTPGTYKFSVDSGASGYTTYYKGTSPIIAIVDSTGNRRGYVQYGEASETLAFVSEKSTGKLAFYSGNTQAMTIDSSQRVGIGTASPTNPLHVQKDNSGDYVAKIKNNGSLSYGLNIDTDSSDIREALHISRGSTPLFSVENGGNVGIGTQSPSQKLHVEGNLNVTGNIWTNGMLVTSSPLIAASADGGKSIIGMKADDGKWVGCAVYNVNGNYEFKCAPNAEVDAKLNKVDAVQACLKLNKAYNEGTHQCYTVQGEQLN